MDETLGIGTDRIPAGRVMKENGWFAGARGGRDSDALFFSPEISMNENTAVTVTART